MWEEAKPRRRPPKGLAGNRYPGLKPPPPRVSRAAASTSDPATNSTAPTSTFIARAPGPLNSGLSVQKFHSDMTTSAVSDTCIDNTTGFDSYDALQMANSSQAYTTSSVILPAYASQPTESITNFPSGMGYSPPPSPIPFERRQRVPNIHKVWLRPARHRPTVPVPEGIATPQPSPQLVARSQHEVLADNISNAMVRY